MIMSTRGQWIKPNWEFSHDWFSWHPARWWLFYRSKWVVLWVVAPCIPSQTGDCVCHLGFWWQEAVSWYLANWLRHSVVPEAMICPRRPHQIFHAGQSVRVWPILFFLFHFFLAAVSFIFGGMGGMEQNTYCLIASVSWYEIHAKRLLYAVVAGVLEDQKFLKHGQDSSECYFPFPRHLLLVHSCHMPLHNWDLKV